MEAFAVAIQSVINDSGFLAFTTGNAIMILVGLILLYLAFAREFEPLLLGPIAFGCVLANIPRNGFEEGVMALISAVIEVGAATEVEMKDKKLRIEDALNATRAAVEEGIVAGGGTTFIDIIPALNTLEATGDVQTGINLVKRAVEEPLRQIAYNAGLEGSVVVEKVKNTEAGVGFNALTEEYIDMVKAGIVDPAKVTRSALQNAASIASLVLTTETIVADKVEENAAAPAMPPMGGMGGMM